MLQGGTCPRASGRGAGLACGVDAPLPIHLLEASSLSVAQKTDHHRERPPEVEKEWSSVAP
eukprot:4289166-Amphidinium_carterae.1